MHEKVGDQSELVVDGVWYNLVDDSSRKEVMHTAAAFPSYKKATNPLDIVLSYYYMLQVMMTIRRIML